MLILSERLLEPLFVLPDQFVHSSGAANAPAWLRRLMFAVLEDVIRTFQKHGQDDTPEGRRLLREAIDWIEDDLPDSPFSFVNVCAILGIDADYLRRGLTKWRLEVAGAHAGTKPLGMRRNSGDRHAIRQRRRSRARR